MAWILRLPMDEGKAACAVEQSEFAHLTENHRIIIEPGYTGGVVVVVVVVQILFSSSWRDRSLTSQDDLLLVLLRNLYDGCCPMRIWSLQIRISNGGHHTLSHPKFEELEGYLLVSHAPVLDQLYCIKPRTVRTVVAPLSIMFFSRV